MITGIGLIKIDGTYFNPKSINTIESGNSGGVEIKTANQEEYAYNDISPEKVANAVIEAQNIGKIVDVTA